MKYETHRIILEAISIATPLQGDTIWGHLTSWLASNRPDLLEAFLKTYRNNDPAVIFSDGLPALINENGEITQYMPVPENVVELFGDRELKKTVKNMEWVSLSMVDKMCKGGQIEIGEPEIKVESIVRMGNAVSRTGEENTGLYPLTLTVLKDARKNAADGSRPAWVVYFRVKSDWAEQLSEPLNSFLRQGYGKKKNIGAGQFKSIDVQEVKTPIVDCPEPNAILMLSGFVPAPDDPSDGRWKVFTKYGKLGEMAAFSLKGYAGAENPNVFKNPVTMIKAGAVFLLNGQKIKEWYGKCDLKGVRNEPDYVHPALGFAVPYRMRVDK